MAYTDWLTESNGKPIARPLHTYGPPQPQQVGDETLVVADPKGRLDTEPPDRVNASWPALLTLGGVGLTVVGLVLAVKAPQSGTGGGSRRGWSSRTSRRTHGRTRR